MIGIWAGFILLILLLLALDLSVFNRRAHTIRMKEALGWSALWIALGIAFGAVVYWAYNAHWAGLGIAPDAVDGRPNSGNSAALKYLTGYILEKALSVDNLFVMAVIFRFLAVPAEFQHRVLFWGILGALVLRGLMIGVGAELITHYHWVLYVFGAFLLITAGRMLFLPERPPDPARDPVFRLARRVLPFTSAFHGPHFLGIDNGRRMLTPLALALLLIETSDVVFAVDSVPAVFTVTADPFLVFTSNIFAILGLRSLYFALAGMVEKFHYLKVSLALVLAVVGLKMIGAHWIRQLAGEYGSLYLLIVVAALLMVGVAASVLFPNRNRAPLETAGTNPPVIATGGSPRV
jgi:tellurite resistance protein TerC